MKLTRYSILASLILAISSIAFAANEPISVTGEGLTRTLQFKIWKSNLEKVDKVGKFRNGIFCTDPTDIYYQFDNYVVSRFSKLYIDRSTKLGYVKYEGSDSAFEDKLGNEPDFRLGATLLALNYDICGGSKEYKGKATISLKIELFSTQHQKIVYSKNVTGSYAAESKIDSEVFDDNLFRSAMDEVFSDPRYVEVFRTGGTSSAPVSTNAIEIKPVPKFEGGVVKNSKALLAATVTIESGVGSGSGFYVSRDGYLLTNQHVVGGAKFVKVKLGEGHSLVGEVMRTDPVRDIALLKTESTPGTLIPIRTTTVAVGEEVYAIGSPINASLSGTFTKGILSAQREINKVNFLQSDVAINHGNSGGPLLDASGSIIGVAQLKGSGVEGINLFIPIKEALDKLNLKLQ